MPYILLIQPLFFDASKETPFASQFSSFNRCNMKACVAPRVPQISQKPLHNRFGGARYHFSRGDAAHVHCRRNRWRYENECDSLHSWHAARMRAWTESQFVGKLFRFDSQHFYTGGVRQLACELPSRDFHRKCQRLYYCLTVMIFMKERGKKRGNRNWNIWQVLIRLIQMMTAL